MFFIDGKLILHCREGPLTVKERFTKEITETLIAKSGAAMEKPSKFAAGDDLANIYETREFLRFLTEVHTMNRDFEKAYQDFLDEQAYDERAAALFPIARVAFRAGWIAAGGELPISALNTYDLPINGSK